MFTHHLKMLNAFLFEIGMECVNDEFSEIAVDLISFLFDQYAINIIIDDKC